MSRRTLGIAAVLLATMIVGPLPASVPAAVPDVDHLRDGFEDGRADATEWLLIDDAAVSTLCGADSGRYALVFGAAPASGVPRRLPAPPGGDAPTIGQAGLPDTGFDGGGSKRAATTHPLAIVDDTRIAFDARAGNGGRCDWADDASKLVVEASVGGSGPWRELVRLDPGDTRQWTHVELEVPDPLRSSETRIRWRETAPGWGRDHWAIDDVTIRTDGRTLEPEPTVHDHDNGDCTVHDDEDRDGRIDGDEESARVPCPDPAVREHDDGTCTVYDDEDDDGRPDGDETGATVACDPVTFLDQDDDGVPDAVEENLCGRQLVAEKVNETDGTGRCSPDGSDYSKPVLDGDGDLVPDAVDNCPETVNTPQADQDLDGRGDACDPDRDGDGVPDDEDAFPDDPDRSADSDGDGVADRDDNCDETPNPDQDDHDEDGQGDACDADDDNDGVDDAVDNCPETANTDQADHDGDGQGDACDGDDDNDGVPDGDDPAPKDPDRDGDGVQDGPDNCADTGNPDQADRDGDGEGDACDANADGDSFEDSQEDELCAAQDRNNPHDGHCHGPDDYHAPGDDNHEG